jgi:hypothetical protein
MSPPSFFFDFLALPFFISPPLSSLGASSARAIVQEVGSNTASTKKHARINFMAFSYVQVFCRSPHESLRIIPVVAEQALPQL